MTPYQRERLARLRIEIALARDELFQTGTPIPPPEKNPDRLVAAERDLAALRRAIDIRAGLSPDDPERGCYVLGDEDDIDVLSDQMLWDAGYARIDTLCDEDTKHAILDWLDTVLGRDLDRKVREAGVSEAYVLNGIDISVGLARVLRACFYDRQRL